MKKLGESTFKGEFKIIKKFLTSLNFELDRTGKHGSIWKNHQKNLITNVTTSSSDWRWYKNWKSDFTKLVSENFTREEIEQLLAKLIKKRKVQYTADGRLRILRISPKLIFSEPEDLEEDLLYALFPPDTNISAEDIIKNIPESLKKKIKKDERKTKIEDQTLFDAIWCYLLLVYATLPTTKKINVSYYSQQEENFNIDHV